MNYLHMFYIYNNLNINIYILYLYFFILNNYIGENIEKLFEMINLKINIM
jgi:hypothetical protein